MRYLIFSGLFLVAACGGGDSGADTAEAANVEPNPDTRQVILLNPAQRHHVLGHMQEFLQGVQGITYGLATDDLDLVAESAQSIGPQQPGDGNELGMNEVLPKEFRMMGKQARISFGEIATLAENGADDGEILAELSTGLAACNACHTIYQLDQQQAE